MVSNCGISQDDDVNDFVVETIRGACAKWAADDMDAISNKAWCTEYAGAGGQTNIAAGAATIRGHFVTARGHFNICNGDEVSGLQAA